MKEQILGPAKECGTQQTKTSMGEEKMKIKAKVCTSCDQPKHIKNFKWNPDKRYVAGGYYHSRCRACEAEYDRQRRKASTERY